MPRYQLVSDNGTHLGVTELSADKTATGSVISDGSRTYRVLGYLSELTDSEEDVLVVADR